MATKKTPTEKGAKKTPTRGKRKPAEAKSTGLSATEIALDEGALSSEAAALAHAIDDDGGRVLARYKDPLQGRTVLFSVLPLDKVDRTSFQRDVSESHVDRLVDAMKKTGAYLDPIICVRTKEGYRSPNGGHRLAALTRMGAKSVTALVLDDERLAYKILALNTEKAHALREKAIEVIRMLDALAAVGGKESDYAAELEEPALVTLGAAYAERGRFAGSAYFSVLRRCDAFFDEDVKSAREKRAARAQKLFALEDAVAVVVAAMKEKGMDSPYLRNAVVARISPFRGRQKDKAEFDDTIDKMIDKAKNLDPSSVDPTAGAQYGGGGEEG